MVAAPPNARGERPRAWSLLLLLFPFAVLAGWQWHWPPPAVDGDFAQYLLHAKALLEGRPYADTGYIVHPDAWMVGPRAYPPGLPLTLAPIVATLGISMPAFRLLMIASLLVFAATAWRRLACDVEPWQAAVGAGFSVFVVESKWATLDPISDPGFIALLWATVLVVDTTDRWTWPRLLLVTVCGGAAVAYRVAGLSVIVAYGIYTVLTWRSHGGRGAIPLVVWAVGGAFAALFVVDPSDLLTLLSGWQSLIPNVGMLAREYGPALPVAMLRPTQLTVVNRLYYLIGAASLLVGLPIMLRRMAFSFLGAVTAVYVLMLVFAPVSEERYLWPLYPLVACTLAVGLREILGWVPFIPDRIPRSVIALTFLMFVAGAATGTELGRARPDVMLGSPNGEALFAWLRQSQAMAPVRIAGFNPRVLALETGVAAMGNVDRSPGGHLKVFDSERITHILCLPDEKSDQFQRVTNSLPRVFPDRFELVYQNSDYVVYRYVPGQASEDAPGR